MVKYTKKAYSTANFACMRGVTDFTNAAQFNLFESGYAHLYVIGMPKWIEDFPDDDVKKMADTFKYILEYEFKGLDGIDDINTDKLEVTDGVSTMNVIGKVTKQSSAEVTMSFTEKSGSVITNFIKFYLEGIKDPRTQAKTYHGLIRSGAIWGGFENEVFAYFTQRDRLTKCLQYPSRYPSRFGVIPHVFLLIIMQKIPDSFTNKANPMPMRRKRAPHVSVYFTG